MSNDLYRANSLLHTLTALTLLCSTSKIVFIACRMHVSNVAFIVVVGSQMYPDQHSRVPVIVSMFKDQKRQYSQF